MIRENKSWSAEGVRRVTLAVDSACADLLSLSPSLFLSLSTPNFIRLSVFVIVAFPFPSFLIFEKKIPRVFPTIHRVSFLARRFPRLFLCCVRLLPSLFFPIFHPSSPPHVCLVPSDDPLSFFILAFIHRARDASKTVKEIDLRVHFVHTRSTQRHVRSFDC